MTNYHWSISNTEYWYIEVSISDPENQLMDDYYEPSFELRFNSLSVAVLARLDLLSVHKGRGGCSNELVVSDVLYNKPRPLDLKKYDEPTSARSEISRTGTNRPRVKPDGSYWDDQPACATNDPRPDGGGSGEAPELVCGKEEGMEENDGDNKWKNERQLWLDFFHC